MKDAGKAREPSAPIVRAGASQARTLRELAARCLNEVWSEAGFRSELERTDSRAWMAAGPGAAPGGFAILRLGPDAGEILLLAVAPERRRRGTGRALLEVALGEARRLGKGRVELEVAEDNRAAIALYESAGFVVVGRRPRYYAGGRDALLLTRRDRPECAESPSENAQCASAQPSAVPTESEER